MDGEHRTQPASTANFAWTRRDVLAAILLFAATAGFSLWQNAHVAVLWDLSFLLDSAYRFTLGQLPYRELPFSYAPLTFVVQAALVKAFGRVYFPHLIYGVLLGGAVTVLSWRILLRLAAGLGAAGWNVSLLLALPLTVLGVTGIYPHPIYDCDATAAVLVSLWLLLRLFAEETADDTPRWSAAIAGMVTVVPLFIKQNVGLAYLGSVLGGLAVIAFAGRRRRRLVETCLWFLAGAVAAGVLAVVVIQGVVGIRNYLLWTIGFAAKRRLPALPVLVSAYRQTDLLWELPCAAAGAALLRFGRERWRFTRAAAVVLLTAPFLWTCIALFVAPDPDDRADQLLALWPELMLLAGVLAAVGLRRGLQFDRLVPWVLLATIHGAFLSQQLWGSTYATWPLLMLLVGGMLAWAREIARPVAAVVAASLLLCGGMYALSHERLEYIHLDGTEVSATLPALRGMRTPGPWIPGFEELVAFADREIPPTDDVLLIPGEDPFFFATGRVPHFPVLLFDPTVDPYTPEETAQEARRRGVRWLLVKRQMQLTGPPHPELPAITDALKQDYVLYRQLSLYDVYRRR